MPTLTVGSGQQYSTVSSAIAAAQSGDTIQVQAGTYTNDTASITKSLTLQSVGGPAVMNMTAAVPNGKGIFVAGAGGANVNLHIDGFVFQNATGPSGNIAGIRYEGGSLTLTNDVFRNNQNGLLATPVALTTGAVSISHSEFDGNGSGTGQTHNIYMGDVSSFSITNSYIHDAKVGHEIKSRAENTTITDNRIYDNNGTSSYSIETPNGGNVTVLRNTIEQGPNGQNPNIIGYGAEDNLHAGQTVNIGSNTVVNDMAGRGTLLYNFTAVPLTLQGNTVYGLTPAQLSGGGPVSASGNTITTSRPTLDTSPPASYSANSGSLTTTQDNTLVLNLSEDAFQGNAQFIARLDGNALGAPASVTASHSLGQDQQFTFNLGSMTDGVHAVSVDFINDASSPQGDRNLYVDGVFVDNTKLDGSTPLYANGTATYQFHLFDHHATPG